MSNCVKEYQNNDCYQKELQYEKNKLHTRYLFIIAGGMLVVAIAMNVGSETALSAQISMASTISSIILSAIAIFMSISGESKNVFVQNQMTETSAKMSSLVENMKKVEEDISVSLKEKLEELSAIKQEIANIKGNVNEMRQMFGTTINSKDKKDDVLEPNNDTIISVLLYTIDNIKDRSQKIGIGLWIMLEYVAIVFAKNQEKNIKLSRKEVCQYMVEKQNYSNKAIVDEIWAIAVVINCMGMNSENTTLIREVLNKVKENIGKSNEEEIIQFHKEFRE